MNYGPLIFLGLIFTMAWSWYGFIFKNFKEVGRLEPIRLATGERYPGGRSGTARMGQEVYQANGCASCHTMQVRVNTYGSDVQRGWGKRNTVLTDFVYDEHVFLGQTRLGPDLANIAARQPNPNWHLIHLYQPSALVPGSMMPEYQYLFEERKIKGKRSPNALILPKSVEIPEGYEVVPTAEANALVEYLVSLKSDTAIFEAPIYPPVKTKPEAAAATADTNAPADPNAAAAPGQNPQ